MRKILLSFLVAAWTFTPIGASAQTINNLGAGTTVTGSDLYPSYQGSNPAVSVTATQLQTFMGTVVQTGPGATGGTCNPGATCTIQTQEIPVTVTSGNITTAISGGLYGELINYNSASDQTPTIPTAASAGNGTYFELCGIQHSQTVTHSGSDTIGGASTYLLPTGTEAAPSCVGLRSDGNSNWNPIPYGGSSGGTPGGSITQLQYNNSGAFGGVSGLTSDGTNATFGAANLRLLGSSTGYTTLESANAGASNYVATFPAATDTVGELGQANAWTGAETHTGIEDYSSTSAPTPAAGHVQINGTITTPSETGQNGSANIYTSASLGLVLQGLGSSSPIKLLSGANTGDNCTLGNGGQWTCSSAITGTELVGGTSNAGLFLAAQFLNTANNSAATGEIEFSNNTAATEMTILWNSSSNTGGNGTSSWTLNNSEATNTGGLYFQTQGTNALTISKAQLVALPAITSDAAQTDATICENTTSHGLYSGSGTGGICLGTSGEQFKNDISAMPDSLEGLMKLETVSFRYKPGFGDNGQRQQIGFLAQNVAKIFPDLVGRDADGNPVSVDYMGVAVKAVRAIQQEQIEIQALTNRLQ